MSRSRLEKFLYALYSLDSSDLPTPLSRIEELYNCWVTGEEPPTFEPLSRVEKYLMAILGVYDVDSLPNPLSRVEVLLYKLATGDDNLDDVKSFLSEHEELLAEIIRNGGVGGNIDIEYVLYTLSTEFNTLYNTAEKPVKSAILKGNTLVNEMTFVEAVDKIVTYKANYALKSGSVYTLILPNNGSNKKVSVDFFNYSTGTYKRYFYTTSRKTVFTAEEDEFLKNIVAMDEASANDCLNAILLEGDYTNIDVPYFEGMQSVKMPVLTTTGKNLFDKEKHKLIPNFGAPQTYYGTDYIKVKPLTTYTRNNQTSLIYYTNYGDTTLLFSTASPTFTTTAETNYIRYNVLKTEKDTHQLEEGSTATTYEPYKSNILTVNEEVELRGVGEVKDELNLLTGELTQRIGEVVLDGSEDETWNNTLGNHYVDQETKAMCLPKSFIELPAVNAGKTNIMVNDFKVLNTGYTNGQGYDVMAISANDTWHIQFVKQGVKTVEKWREFLQSNPIKIKYPLTTESVKTVDLSVVNQDGNDTKLSTFNDITYVTLSSEGLIPEAELEVATKNEEVLNTMSLEMDDISTTQNDLQETLDTQSENVDATMLATTEIYEGLL